MYSSGCWEVKIWYGVYIVCNCNLFRLPYTFLQTWNQLTISIIRSILIVSVTVYGVYSTWYWQESYPIQVTWYNSSILHNVRSMRKSLSSDLKHLKSSVLPLLWDGSLLQNLLPEYKTTFWKIVRFVFGLWRLVLLRVLIVWASELIGTGLYS